MITDKIEAYYYAGLKDIDWYKECEDLFVSIYGRDRLPLITKLFAATSINTSLKANITLFRKALHEMENNLPFSNYLPNIKIQLERLRAGQELSGRKIRSFAAAMSGDVNAVVVDIWLLRAFEMDKKYYRKENSTAKRRGGVRSSGATDKQYTQIENWVRASAWVRGIQPRELSSILWAGVRIIQSGDKETHYKTILKMKLYNMFDV